MLQTASVEERNLTRNQRLVFAVLEGADKPLSAYRILDQLRDSGLNAPLQVYRALEKLIALGRVHRLESLNAFVVCRHSMHGLLHPKITAFEICEACGKVSEFHDDRIEQSLMRHARESGFKIRSTTIEVHGLCKACGGVC